MLSVHSLIVTIMRLLTVPQPMATVLAMPTLHGRPVVNRRFPASYRGPLVLVAGVLDRSALRDVLLASTLADSGLDPGDLPTLRAVAVAMLVDCHQAAGACCAPWGSTSASFFHLVLDDVRALRETAALPARPGLSELDAKERAAVLTAR